MNYKLMLRMLGRTLQVEALALLLPLAFSLVYQEDFRPILYTFILLMLLGSTLSALKSKAEFFSREGFAVVGLIWLVFGLFGALPFWFSGQFGGYLDCLFEIVSGFTTTGASILPQVEQLPRGLLLWRSLSSWLGGMGVLIFTLAFLPKVGGRTQVLVQAESPGPISSKLVPKTAQSSKILYLIYIILTVSEFLALMVGGMAPYDALTTSFATVCTGGFSVMNTSIAAYHLPACEIIITIFMFLGSLNFAVFFLVATRRFRQVLRSDELRVFVGLCTISILLIFWNVHGLYATASDALRDTAFQVLSLFSTTGFSTANYDLWPDFSKTILIFLMFIGGCAGSTAGGIKCSRILLLTRCAHRDILHIAHPRSVKVVKLDGKVVDEENLRTVSGFFVCFLLTIALGCLVVSLDDFSFSTTFSAVLACVSNVGPGMDMVGPLGNYAAFSGLSKLVLTLAMLIGRLEIFPVLILFSPTTWSRS